MKENLPSCWCGLLIDKFNKDISLNDVIIEAFNNQSPSYISIDTEGSEYEILKFFNLY